MDIEVFNQLYSKNTNKIYEMEDKGLLNDQFNPEYEKLLMFRMQLEKIARINNFYLEHGTWKESVKVKIPSDFFL